MADERNELASDHVIRIFEVLAGIRATQDHILTRLDGINGRVGHNEEVSQSHGLSIKRHAGEITQIGAAVSQHTSEIRSLNDAYQQVRGGWKAVAALSAAVSGLVTTALGLFFSHVKP